MFRLLSFLMPIVFLSPSCSPDKESKELAIIPMPMVVEQLQGQFALHSGMSIGSILELENEVKVLSEVLAKKGNGEVDIKSGLDGGQFMLSLDTINLAPEEYVLRVDSESVTLKGGSAQGVFYGVQTLSQLIIDDDEGWCIPNVVIKDAPRFAYRGMHLDVCRHFFSVDFVEKYIDLLALHKMNKLHLHLTEDQGWRIEIDRYPKLVEIGAWRNGTIVGHYPGSHSDNKRYGGYYTKEDINTIVDYAAARHIEVIPEIELPGHSSAAIAAYPSLSCFPEENSIVPDDIMSEQSRKQQGEGKPKIVQESWGVYDDVYCVGKEETFTFLENVLDEVMDMFPSTYVHIGGDECPKGNWERCELSQELKSSLDLESEEELQSYFIERIEKYVNSKGKRILGWDEILEGGLAPNATVMSWRGSAGGIEAAESGHDVIMSPNTHCYFDHYQSEDVENEPLAIGGFLPVEKVYSFDPIPVELEEEYHDYVLGGQANLWTEYITTEEQAEYMLLPRLTALSEALWSQKEVKDVEDFRRRLSSFRDYYDEMGLNYALHFFSQ